MESAQTKAQAHELFVAIGLTRKEIAKNLDIHPNTLTYWIKSGKWVKMKAKFFKTPLQFILDFEDEVQVINREIASRPPGQRRSTAEEARTRSHILTAIHQMRGRLTSGPALDVMIDFRDFVEENDLDDDDIIHDAAHRFVARFVNQSLITRVDPHYTVIEAVGESESEN